jgi:MFS family permease
MSQPTAERRDPRGTTHHPEHPHLLSPDHPNLLNAETPGSVELPASIATPGLPGHEHRAAADFEIPPPTKPVGPLFTTGFAVAQLALFIALLGPVMVSMAIKVIDVVGQANATSAQGLVLSVGAVAALIANPLFGRLSDRTTSRWGRRRPWMVGGAVGLAVFLLVIATAQSLPVLIVGWFGAQVTANACFSAYLATLADQVPPSQAAKISALGGVMQNVGVLAALYVAKVFATSMLPLFMVPALIGVVGMVFFAMVLPDKQLHRKPPSEGLKSWLHTFWVNPKAHPDFAWAWASRFLLYLGSFLFTTFRIFWMIDHLALTAARAAAVVFTGVLVYTLVLVVVGQVAGILSDWVGRRKVFVFGSTALFAIGLALLTQVDSIAGFYGIEALLGAAFGIYMGVDLALVLEVLPNPEDSAKDLGVFNIANAAPQSLAPALGAVLIGIGTKNYDLLYATAGVLTFLGALAIIPIRKVK